MYSKEELLEKLTKILNEKNYSDEDKNLIKKAHDLAVQKHEGQKRASGEDYIIHPISVAINLAEMNVDREMICAGLLHDIVEDTDFTLDDIKNEFGEGTALLVDGVTKISKLKSASRSERQAETIRKMLFTMILDMRVIIVKLADKIHNMSTLEFLPAEKQSRIARETLEIYAPLAGKLGLGLIKNELENLALKALNPTVYEQISKFIKEKENEKLDILTLVSRKLNQKLEKSNIKFHIKSRIKHFYSIYHKMKKYNKKVEDIFDLYGVRIITESVEDCYTIFGIVHSIFQPLPGRFKDYIANPKSNGYRSLHTTVLIDKRKALEIQIRTEDMDHTNEYGIAAHWFYKTGYNPDFKWLNNLKKVQQEELSPEDYYQAIRNDILSEEIYVFSPKGDIIELPKGATPLDFAYKIHTEIGHRCKGAKVNGNIIPLSSPLKNGSVVEVITGKDLAPKREWISIVKSIEAKKKIRHFFTVLDKEKEKERKDIREKEKEEQLKQKKISEAATQQIKNRDSRIKEKSSPSDKIAIEIDGEKNFLFTFAKCCRPNPQDDIIGYVSVGRGIIIHRKDCPEIKHIKDFDERKINVNWGSVGSRNIYSFFIKTPPNNSSFVEISNVLKKYKGSIREYSLDNSTKTGDRVDGYFSIELPSKINVNVLFKELSKLPSIYFIGLR